MRTSFTKLSTKLRYTKGILYKQVNTPKSTTQFLNTFQKGISLSSVLCIVSSFICFFYNNSQGKRKGTTRSTTSTGTGTGARKSAFFWKIAAQKSTCNEKIINAINTNVSAHGKGQQDGRNQRRTMMKRAKTNEVWNWKPQHRFKNE